MGIRLLHGDCRTVLPTLADGSVQCVVTSPPYWGLRDYGTEGQLGLEPTPEEYVENLVGVFREVRRVLRDDGVVWLNLGDSYAGSWGNQGRKEERGTQRPINGGMLTPVLDGRYPSKESNTGTVPPGLKQKDLVGIPWRVAFALQADGWFLRADVIWAKPNPMPESITDRPTKAHEYVFLLSKSARYFYDADAVREPAIHAGRLVNYDGTQKNCSAGDGVNDRRTLIARPITVASERNLRSVWTITTEPTPDAHFATFPRKLVTPCILAGTSAKGCCAQCGAPWAREVNPGVNIHPGSSHTHEADAEMAGTQTHHSGIAAGTIMRQRHQARGQRETTGWQPTCDHDAAVVPCTVLDPFGGTGTVGRVAEDLGRHGILIELNGEYVTLAKRKTSQRGLFAMGGE